MVRKIRHTVFMRRSPPQYKMKMVERKKEWIESALDEVYEHKTIEAQIKCLVKNIAEFKDTKASEIEIPADLPKSVDRRFHRKCSMEVIARVIKQLEAMKKTLEERQKGRWEKKQQKPPAPAPTAVEKILEEIKRKSVKIPPNKEVLFIKDVLKDKDAAVVRNEKVRENLLKTTGLNKAFFDVLIDDILKQKESKKKK